MRIREAIEVLTPRNEYSRVVDWITGNRFNLTFQFDNTSLYWCVFTDGKIETVILTCGGGRPDLTLISDLPYSYINSWRYTQSNLRYQGDNIILTGDELNDWNRPHRFDIATYTVESYDFTNSNGRYNFPIPKISSHLEPVFFQKNKDDSANRISYLQLRFLEDLQIDIDVEIKKWTLDITSSPNLPSDPTEPVESVIGGWLLIGLNYHILNLKYYLILIPEVLIFYSTSTNDLGELLTTGWTLNYWSRTLAPIFEMRQNDSYPYT